MTINAVYPSNQHSEKVRELTENLLREARGAGATSLAVCPLNDGTTVSAGEKIGALRGLAPMAYRILSNPQVSHRVLYALLHRPNI
ncbi:hypothetical protein ETR_10277 [Erwinia tracheiphila PSU-1]|nr:hypothetical protein ETR_10277 [Erwinia tracheiphila PSU-1]